MSIHTPFGRRVRGLLGAALAALAIAALLMPAARAAGVVGSQTETLRFDVAEDMNRFVFDKDVTFEDGLPKHGSSFITQGYIYPSGTLDCPPNEQCTGVNADGSAQFPDKVLGEWTCRGWFVGEGAHATSGPMVVTTQILNLGPRLGRQTIVTEGYELADVGVAIERAITGGTGKYSLARGEMEQAFLGFNATEGVTLRLELKVQKR